MDCFIFGAGASKSYKDSPTGQKMPLAKEFFKVFNELKISENPWVLIGYILNYVRDNYGVNPIEFPAFNEDIEEIHSEIHSKFLKAQKNNDIENMLKYSSANLQLTSLFVSVINEIQNGPISQAHLNFVNSLEKNDSIITFNWDTLLDRALSHEKKWNSDTGYYVIPKQVYRNSWVNPEPITSEYELIKLHGSTNWLTSYPIFDKNQLKFTHATGDNDVFIYEDTIDNYPCYDGRFIKGYQPFSYGYYPPNLFVESIKPKKDHVIVRITPRNGFNVKGTANSDGIVSMPLIITPIKNKEYNRFGNLFEKLWSRAQQKIQESDRIFIIGYSFPKTDLKTNELFISAFLNRVSIPEIIIVNPYPEEIYNKFLFEFGIPKNRIYCEKCFIDKDYNFNKWKT